MKDRRQDIINASLAVLRERLFRIHATSGRG